MSRNRKKRNRTSRPPATRRRATPTPNTTSIEIGRPPTTEYVYLTAVPMLEVGKEPPGGPAGTDGIYDVSFVLGIPGVGSVVDELKIDTLLRSGDSLIASHPLHIGVTGPDAVSEWVIDTNEHGRLSVASISMVADTFVAAEAAAHDLVMPILSALAFHANAGVEVKATYIVERSSGTVCVAANVMGAIQTLTDTAGWLTPELRPFLASYREGLNSTAPLYQALSFYKVIEGVKTFHSNRVRAARRAGQTPPDDPLVAIVPNSFDDLTREPETVRALLANYGGKTFDEVREAFADTIRNAIAHLTPGRDIRVADYLGDLKACRLATPVLRFVAREILRAEIAALGPPATPSE